MVSLLNAHGGIIAYGVRPSGIIYGEEINRREQDMLNHTVIDEAAKRIIPAVPGAMYSVQYVPVDMPPLESGEIPPKMRKVLLIRIEPGKPYQLYEDMNHEVGVRGTQSPPPSSACLQETHLSAGYHAYLSTVEHL